MLTGRQYYGLVSGLRELTLEGGDKGLDTEAVREEILEDLSRGDRRTVELFYEWNEIAATRDAEDPDERRERFEEYYARCARSRSEFLREWSRFDLDLRTRIAARTLPLLGIANLIERERAIDLLRWEKADELSEFDTFGMPTILAYLVKVGIIGRWVALDPAVGREMYDKLVNSMEPKLI